MFDDTHSPTSDSSLPQGPHFSMRSFRPSLLDQRFTDDPWIVEADEGLAALCLGGYQLTRIRLVMLDLPSLNRLFGQLRQGQQRCCGRCG
jgi:hypothetical protein